VDVLRQYVARGGVLIRVSAGAILMTPDIRTTLLCGDTLPAEEIEPRGLGLVDFAFVPHLGRHVALNRNRDLFTTE
jgi:dipeptidase E